MQALSEYLFFSIHHFMQAFLDSQSTNTASSSKSSGPPKPRPITKRKRVPSTAMASALPTEKAKKARLTTDLDSVINTANTINQENEKILVPDTSSEKDIVVDSNSNSSKPTSSNEEIFASDSSNAFEKQDLGQPRQDDDIMSVESDNEKKKNDSSISNTSSSDRADFNFAA
jgi:hypothetical protein